MHNIVIRATLSIKATLTQTNPTAIPLPAMKRHRCQKLKVMMLWRYNQLNPFKGSTPRFEAIVVSGLSFHRAKGLEADYTILLDVSEGDYGRH
jgi:hypothetical protein